MSSFSEREEGTRLIRAAELRQLGTDKVVALVQNMKPVIARRVTYYEDKELLPLFEGQTGRLPEPPSLYPEDTNPFLSKRLTAEAEREGEVPTTRAAGVNENNPIEPEVEEPDEAGSGDTDETKTEDPASESNAVDQVEEGEAEALEVLNEIQHHQALILARIPEARGRWRHGELDVAGRESGVRPNSRLKTRSCPDRAACGLREATTSERPRREFERSPVRGDERSAHPLHAKS